MIQKRYLMLYLTLSKALRDSAPPAAAHYMFMQWVADCKAVADTLTNDNPRFDRQRFLRDCGVQS